jgi:hypothetical protein
MLNKQTLTEAQLKSLILVRFNMQKANQVKLSTRIEQELGDEFQAEDPAETVIKNDFLNLISGLLACRLLRNNLTEPLITPEDYNQIEHWILTEVSKLTGAEPTNKERESCKKYLVSMFENITEMVHEIVPPNTNRYEEYWKWVTTALDVASERGVLPEGLFELEGVSDEITRRMYSKEQYINISKRTQAKMLDFDTFKKNMFMPMIDLYADDATEEERRELEDDFDVELKPQILKRFEKMEAIFNTFLNEEVARIYRVS